MEKNKKTHSALSHNRSLKCLTYVRLVLIVSLGDCAALTVISIHSSSSYYLIRFFLPPPTTLGFIKCNTGLISNPVLPNINTAYLFQPHICLWRHTNKYSIACQNLFTAFPRSNISGISTPSRVIILWISIKIHVRCSSQKCKRVVKKWQ